METLVQDLRYALRSLRQRPAFTALATLTLGLGIAANAAIFSVVNAVLLEALPFADAESLVIVLGAHVLEDGVQSRGLSYPELLDLRQRNRSFEAIAGLDGTAFNLGGDEGAEQAAGEMVSAGYFEILGVEPIIGRTLRLEDDRVGADDVVIVGAGLWQRRFAGDTGRLGDTLRIDGRPHTVVGVVPAGFGGIGLNTEVWIPLVPAVAAGSEPERLESRGQRWLTGIGRIRHGVGLAAAVDDADAIAAALEATHPDTNADRGFLVQRLRDNYLGSVGASLWVLLGAVGCMLLVACANVASLVLARSEGRRREVALRVALGAGRGRVARELLTETLVLSFLAAAIGLLLVIWSLDSMVACIPPGLLPAWVSVELDRTVFAFSLAIACAAGLGFGIVPALQATRTDLATSLKENGRSAAGAPGAPGLRSGLVVAEIALTVLLLVGAGLVVRSLRARLEIDPGFDADGLLVMRVSLPPSEYDAPESIATFTDRLLDRVRALPGVEAAAMGADAPLRNRTSASYAEFEGFEPADGDRVRYYRHRVTPGYFETLRMQLVRGRTFDARDTGDAAAVVVVGESVARRYWPGADPIGRRIRTGSRWRTVVGVVGDVKFRNLTDDLIATDVDPDLYFPLAQAPATTLELHVRAADGVEPLVAAVRRQLSEVAPDIPVANVARMEDLLAGQTGLSRLASLLLGVFSGLAMVLGAVGIYGLVSFTVAHRVRELGVRIAMGATPGHIVRLVVLRGVALAAAGAAVGSVSALALTDLLDALLFGVRRSDPATFAVAIVLVMSIATLACWIPARRASRTDPLAAFRSE